MAFDYTWTGKPSETDLTQGKFFLDRITAVTKKYPDKPAIIEGNRCITFSHLYAQAQAISRKIGSKSGTRIALKITDKPNLFSAIIAVHMSEGTVVCVDVDDAPSMIRILKDSQSTVLLHENDDLSGADTEALQAALPNLKKVCVGAIDDMKILDIDWAYGPKMIDGNAIAHLFYTSGTTGNRKGVMISQSAYMVPADTLTHAMHYNHKVKEYLVGNISHSFAFGRIRNLACLGATTVLDNGSIIPQKILASMEKHGCNALAAPGSVITMFLAFFKEKFVAIGPKLKLIKAGSQKLNNEVKMELMALFPQTRLVQQYGASEAQRSVFNDLRTAPNLETTGKVLPGYELEIRDEEGRSVAEGQGQIWIKGEHIASSYWNRPEKNRQSFKGGWYRTGDLGALDSQGYLTLNGRVDDIINFGGQKLSPTEIEASLKPLLKDLKFVVFGIPDPSGIVGEVPAICIESADGKKGMLIRNRDWPKRRISIIKAVGKTLPFVPKIAFNIDGIPMTGSGKPKRKTLTELASE